MLLISHYAIKHDANIYVLLISIPMFPQPLAVPFLSCCEAYILPYIARCDFLLDKSGHP